MDRREFLKTLGLGSIALTLPKPLNIMAARMSDLTAPPVHAGLARFRDLAGVMVYDFGISCIDRYFANPNRYMDFVSTWEVHLVAHENSENYIPILKEPVKRLVIGNRFEKNWLFMNQLPQRMLVPTMLDVWIVPYGKPKYALPPVTAVKKVENQSWYKTIRPRDLSTQVRTVRLERARAIDLGLVSPSDPFEDL